MWQNSNSAALTPHLTLSLHCCLCAGKGLGLQATQDLMPGELILVSHPIGIAFGPAGSMPSNADLEAAIQVGALPAPC